MNKGDLVKAIAKKAGIAQTKAAEALDAFTSEITKALKKGDSTTLVGFGTFKVASRAARTGRNPQTGQPLKIPASKVAKFTPGKDLKAAVNR